MNALDSSSLPDPTQQRYVRFPPRWRNVLVPTRPARATSLGITLYAASRPLPWLVQYGLWCGATLAGGRSVPGRRETWAPSVPAESFAALCAQWVEAVGGRYDGLAVYERLQAARAGLTVMVCARDRSMLVRVHHDSATFAQERAISAAAKEQSLATIRIPELVGSGETGGLHWVGYEVMSARPHRPRYRLDPDGYDEISALVESVVPRPADMPAHWRGAHCDLTPWNLRRTRSATWLIDWEDAQWAPPHTDALFLRTTVAAIGRRPTSAARIDPDEEEARRFCAAQVTARASSVAEHHLRSRLLQILGTPRAS